MLFSVDGDGAHDILLADCPARTALELLSGSWSVVALYALRHGPRSFGELGSEIGGISNKVLTQTLRRLERHGLIVRTPSGRSVRYHVTDLGRTTLHPVSVLAEWAHQQAEAIADAQRALTGRAADQ